MSSSIDSLKASLRLLQENTKTLSDDVIQAEAAFTTLLETPPDDTEEDDPDTPITVSGQVVGWGRGDFLPVGTLTVPDEVSSHVCAISCGLSNYAMALKTTHEIVTWVISPVDGSPPNPTITNTQQIPMRAISAGSDHFMALTQAGEVMAWGGNGEGQCNVPNEAKAGIVAIAAAYQASVALTYTGEVLVWGRSEASLQGVGLASVPDEARSGIIDIQRTHELIIAIKEPGKVVVWGQASYGQTNPPFLTQDGIIAVDAGRYHCLAVKNTGQILAWGKPDEPYVDAVNDAPFIANIKKVIASNHDSAVLTNDGVLTLFTQSYGEFQSAPFVNGQQHVLDFDICISHCLALIQV